MGSGIGGFHTTLAFPIEIDRVALREGTPQWISIGMFFGMFKNKTRRKAGVC